MPGPSEHKRVLITVRTYPTPAKKGVEVSCTAGITDKGDWIRLFPVPYRRMLLERRFKKYQWVDLDVRKASDPRPESYTPHIDSISIGELVRPQNNWRDRKAIVLPLEEHCLCCIERIRNTRKFPTLGIFRPKKNDRLLIEPDDPNWTSAQSAILHQSSFLDEAPKSELEKIPYKFKYEFSCEHEGCPGHTRLCTDWEMSQSYRRWHREYGSKWKEKFRERYEHDMICAQ
jgi:hypothetical protein